MTLLTVPMSLQLYRVYRPCQGNGGGGGGGGGGAAAPLGFLGYLNIIMFSVQIVLALDSRLPTLCSYLASYRSGMCTVADTYGVGD